MKYPLHVRKVRAAELIGRSLARLAEAHETMAKVTVSTHELQKKTVEEQLRIERERNETLASQANTLGKAMTRAEDAMKKEQDGDGWREGNPPA